MCQERHIPQYREVEERKMDRLTACFLRNCKWTSGKNWFRFAKVLPTDCRCEWRGFQTFDTGKPPIPSLRVQAFLGRRDLSVCDERKWNICLQVLLVDGNIAIGKKDFGHRLSKNFDLRFYPPVPDSRVYVHNNNNFDRRELNSILPESCKVSVICFRERKNREYVGRCRKFRIAVIFSHALEGSLLCQCLNVSCFEPKFQFYTLDDFYAEKNPHCGRVGKLQMFWFWKKVENYCSACLHLLSSGKCVALMFSRTPSRFCCCLLMCLFSDCPLQFCSGEERPARFKKKEERVSSFCFRPRRGCGFVSLQWNCTHWSPEKIKLHHAKM